MRRDRFLITVVFIALSCPLAEGWAQPAGTDRVDATDFHLNTARQRDGRIRLTLSPKPGVAQDSGVISRQAQLLADRIAVHECPRGYDFYAAEPLEARWKEPTYVFKCK
jgi:hypothetical protein